MFNNVERSQNHCKMRCRQACWTALTLLLLPLAGCAHSGELNLFGAYFPIWLLAILVGAAAAFACRFLFVRFRIEPYMSPLTLIYVCIAVSVSCLVWLIFA